MRSRQEKAHQRRGQWKEKGSRGVEASHQERWQEKEILLWGWRDVSCQEEWQKALCWGWRDASSQERWQKEKEILYCWWRKVSRQERWQCYKDDVKEHVIHCELALYGLSFAQIIW